MSIICGGLISHLLFFTVCFFIFMSSVSFLKLFNKIFLGFDFLLFVFSFNSWTKGLN